MFFLYLGLTKAASAIIRQHETRLADTLETARRVFTDAKLTYVGLHVTLVDICRRKQKWGWETSEDATCTWPEGRSCPAGPRRQMERVTAGHAHVSFCERGVVGKYKVNPAVVLNQTLPLTSNQWNVRSGYGVNSYRHIGRSVLRIPVDRCSGMSRPGSDRFRVGRHPGKWHIHWYLKS